MSKKSNDTQMDFESMLNELVQLVETMERGGSSLDHSLKQFERGIELIGRCQKKLQAAELRVRQLVQQEEKEVLVNYLDPSERADSEEKD